ncbi:MAG: hypothetical protein AAGB13_02335 [Cyanobacteria bacterium P01_F01_bin.33]
MSSNKCGFMDKYSLAAEMIKLLPDRHQQAISAGAASRGNVSEKLQRESSGLGDNISVGNFQSVSGLSADDT